MSSPPPGLLTAAIAVLDSPDLADTVARHVRADSPGSPSKSPWARVLARHHSACSPELREAAEPATRAYRRLAGPHSPKAPARIGGYRPEHIPALLQQNWYDEHLTGLGYRVHTSMRRAGAVLLVQWASGGSMGDAAGYLGIRHGRPQHSFAQDLARWLREHGSGDFTAALRGLAAQLDATPGLVNYQRRRQAMQEWCLDPDTWQQLTDRLPPVPGPVQPILDDRKRQEASAFTWAHVTQGEPRFPPARSRPASPSQFAGPGPRNEATPGTSSPTPAGSFTTSNCASSSSSTATASQKRSTAAVKSSPAPRGPAGPGDGKPPRRQLTSPGRCNAASAHNGCPVSAPVR